MICDYSRSELELVLSEKNMKDWLENNGKCEFFELSCDSNLQTFWFRHFDIWSHSWPDINACIHFSTGSNLLRTSYITQIFIKTHLFACVCVSGKDRAVDGRQLAWRFAGSVVKHQQAQRKEGGCYSLQHTLCNTLIYRSTRHHLTVKSQLDSS